MLKTSKKTKRTVRTEFRYFTRELLIAAAQLGVKWDYNRQIDDSIAEVPDGKYPVVFWMPHHHRHFVPCEEHIRCMISLKPFADTVVFCDVPESFWLGLPSVFVKTKAA